MVVEVLLWGALLLLLWLSFLKKPSGLPPGRWGLPLVGYLPLTTRSMQQQLTDLRKKHGDMYLWRIGTQVIVFLHDHHLIREAFNRPEFQDRPNWASFRFMEDDTYGVLASNGVNWHNNRRFTLRQLRDQGMGKSMLVAAVHTQATQLVQEFKKQAGRPAPIPHGLNIAIINIIWQMVGGKQFLLNDQKMIQLDKMMDDVFETFKFVAIPDFFPWIKYLIPSFLLRRIFKINAILELREKLYDFFKEEIEDHRATLDRDNPRDLIDGYLMEMEERKDDPDTTFKDKDLLMLILDLFTAGKETTSSTLTWLIYYLATNPQVQCKMQAEIDEVLPRGTLAILEDKARLPYTEAVIHETLRVNSLTAFGVQHVTSQDTTLGGYTIPKGTIFSSANMSVHYSSCYWDQPDQFLPERWLNDNGKFATKKEGFLPFSIGKRQCVGESLARMELLIISTTLFQSLNFSIPPGKTLSLEPITGNPFFRRHVIQDLLVTVRS